MKRRAHQSDLAALRRLSEQVGSLAVPPTLPASVAEAVLLAGREIAAAGMPRWPLEWGDPYRDPAGCAAAIGRWAADRRIPGLVVFPVELDQCPVATESDTSVSSPTLGGSMVTSPNHVPVRRSQSRRDG